MANKVEKTETKKVVASKNTAKKAPKKVEAKKPTKKVETKKVEVKKEVKKQPKKVEAKKTVKEPVMANIMEDEKKEKKVNFQTVKFIGSAIFWIVLGGLALVWVTDFVRVAREEKPIFCVKTVEHKYDDGKVTECIGLGYKVYNYDRKSFDKGVEFGPLFTKERVSK